MANTIREVSDLHIEFHDHDLPETVVWDFDLMLDEGEIVGLVGESGSGKSMSAMAIAGLLPRHKVRKKGRITYGGIDLLTCSRDALRAYQGSDIGVIFQEPMTALDPLKKVGWQVEEPLKLHHPEIAPEERRRMAIDELRKAELEDPERVYDSYPFELSGGQRQRVCIAAAMIGNPRILIADEPTTALDVLVQEDIIALLRKINREEHVSILFISHDLSLVRQLCTRVLVMHSGRIVESGRTEEVFLNPQDPYTKKLISSIPKVDPDDPRKMEHKLSAEPVLELRNVNICYRERGTALKRRKNITVARDVSFTLHRGETLALVGGSGSGKSTIARAITGINKNYTGTIVKTDPNIQMVFQDPAGSLNPAHRIEWILEEPLKIAGGMTREERKERVRAQMRLVHLDEELLDRFPSQLSGGQRQRVCIAAALIRNPKILIADEPVSALDVTIQTEILALLRDLQKELSLSVIFISHDLRTVYQLCDNIVILKEGKIVEQGDVDEIYMHPKDAYTKKLLKAAGIH